jgi:hypothetical protein
MIAECTAIRDCRASAPLEIVGSLHHWPICVEPYTVLAVLPLHNVADYHITTLDHTKVVLVHTVVFTVSNANILLLFR